MEHVLALIAGAGDLPGRAAAEARRQGWRVVALAFGEAPGLTEHAEAVVSCRLAELGPALAELERRAPRAAVFVGKLWKQEAFARGSEADATARRLAGQGLSDAALADTVVSTLGGLGIAVLDQRQFLGPWLASTPVLTARRPSEDEWTELRAGFGLARRLAGEGIGQTVVRCRGVTVAVEAVEGTDEAIRRGTTLAGPGAVVVKATALAQDYRFDIPAVGPATVRVMAEGGATALAVERGRVLLAHREEAIRLAEDAGIALVTLDGDP
jgi:UDP-2,3-diacylglucosamine hydrolase